MARKIQGIFIDPPIAIARLGGSDAPQDAYRWVEADNPRSDGSTVIDPWWTLDILSDGSVEPRKPVNIRLRDGELIRPVAPFFEIWAFVGEDDTKPGTWKEVPLTPRLLKSFGVDESAITITVDAKNRKAARRMANPDLVFGTFPPVSVSGQDHEVHVLQATNPPDARRPMIPLGKWISLGSVQAMRSRAQPAGKGVAWEDEVDVEVLRFRFTPAKGRFYGPPQAVAAGAVEPINSFLDAGAGWFDAKPNPNVEPGDIFDSIGDTDNNNSRSLGVVDDTCEARATVTLTLTGKAGREFSANATILVGPPDFGPDRRPFLSLADELNDRRAGNARRNAALNGEELELWVQDLFERIYETVSLFNLDQFQRERGILLTGRRLRRGPLPGDHVTRPKNHAMTRMDRLRNSKLYPVDAPNRDQELPLHEHARRRHKELQDIDKLKELIIERPGRLTALVRMPFEVEAGETGDGVGLSTMRMPPFMRNSNGFPLTLSPWQYELLMKWVRSVQRRKTAKKKKPDARKLSPEAASRQERVLAQLDGRRR